MNCEITFDGLFLVLPYYAIRMLCTGALHTLIGLEPYAEDIIKKFRHRMIENEKTVVIWITYSADVLCCACGGI